MQPELAQLQSWFLTAMTCPGGAPQGAALAQQRFGLAPEQVLTRPQRLSIYADGYVLRLLDCLQAEFPVLRQSMGPELFDFFARAYLWRHPSRSSTLYDLGTGFADFLAASQPQGQHGAGAVILQFPIDLARLERARAEAGRALGLENRTGQAQAGGFDGFGGLLGEAGPLLLPPCTRLLALSFPVRAFWEQAQGASDKVLPPQPAASPSFVAIARWNYRISMHALEPWQFYFLQAAAEPAPLQQCALQAASAADLPVDQVLADATLWLPVATAAGMVTQVDQTT
ncbi:HvfC/BufC N-terminal domain-containing protein [Janthinobacterium aquaticum]|uniref:HvfC/BufC N-terminal domain-containing protein n=1 Tax=Janthinobacterium sp. FT58W TaxID=2654254 RepID=UPI001265368A|nr:DNA-binding domain-containing protein [Janthinobacterium sp. FT58W]KAB8038210.1 DUF2063 domain-containing protein [Janthinobacterium sp. FT58W]